MKSAKEKTVYLEVIRLIAIFLVMLTHTGERGVHLYQTTDNALVYWSSLSLYVLAQASVPLFFLTSGALLLKKEESVSYVYKHRILRMVLVTLLAVFFQYFMNYLKNPAIGLDVKSYLRILYTGGAITQQWFLYHYIVFLMVLPFLQRVVKKIEDGRMYEYLFLLWIVFRYICPCVELITGWDSFGNGASGLLSSNVIFYPLMGYYAAYYSQERFGNSKKMVGLCLLGGAVLVTNDVMNHITIRRIGSAAFVGTFAAVYAIVLFILVRYLLEKRSLPVVLRTVLVSAGSCVFGVYLLEPQARDAFVWMYDGLAPIIGYLPALLLWLCCSVAGGCIVIYLIRCIPGVKKLI